MSDPREIFLKWAEFVIVQNQSFNTKEAKYKKDLIKAFEDIFISSIIENFYLSNENSLENFLSSLDKDSLSAKFPFLMSVFSDFRNELSQLVLNIDGDLIRIVGDVHPDRSTKIRVDNKIVYREKFTSYNLEDFLSKDDIYRNYFPKKSSNGKLIFRDYIEPSYNTTSIDEIRKYYYNFGFIIPLILYLRAIDLFAENMLVDLPFPKFFDFECLFMPGNDREDEYSIEYTGLINNNTNRDISALTGGLEPQVSLLKSILTGSNNRPVIKWRTISKRKLMNIPFIDNVLVNPFDFVESLENGYKQGLTYLRVKEQEIFDFINQNQIFTRVLLRPTRNYRSILLKYYYPQTYRQYPNLQLYLMEQLEKQDFIFKSIARERKSKENIIEYEVGCLSKNVIPIFYMDIKTDTIIGADGFPLGLFPYSPYEIFNHKRESFDWNLNPITKFFN